MPSYSWSLPAFEMTSAGSDPSNFSLEAAMRSMFGVDIWLDVSGGDTGDRVVEASGDWKLVREEQAVRQSLLRRLITNPGDWKTKPDYGVGARQFIKRRATQATADELITRIRGQFTRDKRVEKVLAVTVEWADGLMRIAVAIRLVGRELRSQPMLVQTQMR